MITPCNTFNKQTVTGKRVHLFRLFSVLGSGIVMTLISFAALAHGYMLYPPSRALEHMDGDKKAWPVAGIKAKFRREPCLGVQQNANFAAVDTGPLKLKFMYPDGANHVGSCTAYLLDPLNPDNRIMIGESGDCARSENAAAGIKGNDIPGHMAVYIPDKLPCDPSHCVLQWVWIAKHRSHTNPERFEHYDSCADLTVNGATQASSDITSTSVNPSSSAGNLDIAIGLGHLQHLLNFALVNGGLENEEFIENTKRRIEALPIRSPVSAESALQAKASNQRGVDLLRQGQMAEALQAFNTAYSLHPYNAEIVNNLGYAYLQVNDPEAAEPLLRLSLVIDPGRANAWANLGQGFAMRQREREAIAAFALAYRYSGNRTATARFLQKMVENGYQSTAEGNVDDSRLRMGQAAGLTLQLPYLQE